MAQLTTATLVMEISADGSAALKEFQAVQNAAETMAERAGDSSESASSRVEKSFLGAGKRVVGAASQAGAAVEKAAEGGAKKWTELADKLSNVGKTMSVAVTAPLTGLYAAMVNQASDLTETVSKTETVFGSAFERVRMWSESAVQSMGLAQGTALDMAAGFGDMATSMGFTQQAAADMSMDLTQLAADMASFKNISIDVAQTALTSVFTGETESLKSLGVVMTQANLQAYALSQGIQTNIADMTQAEQVALRYSYVMAQTANAQGDFARTGDSLANQTRKLTQTLKQAGESFGTLLAPVVTEVVASLQQAVEWLASLDDGTKSTILSVGAVVAAAGPLLLVLSQVIRAVTTLRTALSALSVNPVLLALTAAAAGFVAIKSAIDGANDAIDTTTDSYRRMQAVLEQGVKPSVDLSGLTSEPVTIPIDADTQAAAERALALIDELQTNPEYAGKLTIDGDPAKAEEALAALRSAVQAMLSGNGSVAQLQAALDACEELTISPDMDEAARAALLSDLGELRTQAKALLGGIEGTYVIREGEDSDRAALDDLISRVEELGWTEKRLTVIGEFEVDEGTTEEINAYAEAIVNAASATSDYQEAVSDLNSLLDQRLAAQIANLNQQAAEQLAQQARLYNSGIIDEATYYANVETILSGLEQQRTELEQTTAAAQALNEVYANGDKSDDYTAAGATNLELHAGETINTEDYQAAVAALVEASQNGEADLTALQTEAATVMAGLADQAIANYDAMIAAQDAYDDAVEGAESKYEPQIAALEEQIAVAQQLGPALEEFSTGMDMLNGDTEAAIDYAAESLATNAEEYETIRQQLTELLSDPNGELLEGDAALGMAGEQYQNLAASLSELETQLATAQSNYTAALTEAETAFTSTMASIDTTFTAQQTQTLMGLAAQTGIAMDQTTVEMVAGVSSMMEQANAELASGADGVVGEVSAMVAAIGGEASTAQSEGAEIGASITAGITAGLNNGTGALYSRVRSIVNQAIAEAKAAAKTGSPSRRMRDEVGVQLVRGVTVGVEEETPSAVAAMRDSINRVISGAAGVTHAAGAAVATRTAAGTGIDYDRMGAAVSDAVGKMSLSFNVDGRRFAYAMRDDNARQLALRGREVDLARGRISRR